jgi:hypothetical protein
VERQEEREGVGRAGVEREEVREVEEREEVREGVEREEGYRDIEREGEEEQVDSLNSLVSLSLSFSLLSLLSLGSFIFCWIFSLVLDVVILRLLRLGVCMLVLVLGLLTLGVLILGLPIWVLGPFILVLALG